MVSSLHPPSPRNLRSEIFHFRQRNLPIVKVNDSFSRRRTTTLHPIWRMKRLGLQKGKDMIVRFVCRVSSFLLCLFQGVEGILLL
jgi:hypothetical protein